MLMLIMLSFASVIFFFKNAVNMDLSVECHSLLYISLFVPFANFPLHSRDTPRILFCPNNNDEKTNIKTESKHV